MNVRQILKGKGSQAVESIPEDHSVATAAGMLAQLRIGALVVAGKTTDLAGIISERDLVRALAAQGVGCMERPVSDYMTRDVVCAAPSDSIDEVLRVMTTQRFRHMPVKDGEKLVGVISIGDAVKARIEGLERENAALADWIKSG